MNLEFSSGGIVYKNKGGKVFWLVTCSSPSKEYPQTFWRLPKGWIDDEGNSPGPFARGEKKADENKLQETALREVREEAGVDAKIIKKVGTVKFFFTKKEGKTMKFVTFYLMEWKKDLPEGFGFETSEIKWLPFESAIKKIKHKSEKEVIEKACEILESETSSRS